MDTRGRPHRSPVAAELSRRQLLRAASVLGAGALVMRALPVADRLLAADPALAAVPIDDALLQAYADTIIPGRKAGRTDLGDEIHPQAIAGADGEAGAVEADALRLYRHPLTGFSTLAPVFIGELSARSLTAGGSFLSLSFEKRTEVVLAGLDFGNPTRVIWEAAAAVPFTAFCAAAVHPIGTSTNASGYRVMDYPGAAPRGYRDFSYRRTLNRGRTRKGYLP